MHFAVFQNKEIKQLPNKLDVVYIGVQNGKLIYNVQKIYSKQRGKC